MCLMTCSETKRLNSQIAKSNTKSIFKSHLPKSPMPKHMSSASYNNLTDLAFESEEEGER